MVSIENLKRHIEFLAKNSRVPGTEYHKECQYYIKILLENYGYEVEDFVFPYYDFYGHKKYGNNIIGKIECGKDIILLGAHYDTAIGTPGADDNASGVSALLEIARCIKESKEKLNCSIWIVAFDLEEYGFIGSHYLVEHIKCQNIKVKQSIVLESIGYTSNKKVYEILPGKIKIKMLLKRPLIAVRYLTMKSDFVVIAGDNSSRNFVNILKRNMDNLGLKNLVYITKNRGIELPQVRLSDHRNFWDNDIPSIMVTDTAFMRNPNYHKKTDTIETIDFDFLEKIANSILYTILA